MHYLLLSPMTWALLWMAATWLTWARARAWWRVVLAIAGIAIVLLCTPLGANTLIRMVEGGVPREARCDARDAQAPIVVLAGGLQDEPRAHDDYIALTPSSWRRLRGGVELWRRGAPVTMTIAGGGPFAISEAAVLARLAQDWGVPAQWLREEAQSTTTWESAMALRGTLPETNNDSSEAPMTSSGVEMAAKTRKFVVPRPRKRWAWDSRGGVRRGDGKTP